MLYFACLVAGFVAGIAATIATAHALDDLGNIGYLSEEDDPVERAA